MKVLFFTKYSEQGASSRLRSYQYFPLLQKDNIEIVVKPLFDSSYVNDILKNRKSTVKILKLYVKRFFALLTIRKFDSIVIEKELFPYFSSIFERIIFLLGYKYTVIYDDAIFHNYDLHSRKILRFLLRKKIDRVMQYSSCVIVGNDYLKQKAVKSKAKKIVVIPTVIDTVNKYKEIKKRKNDSLIIGWIGSPSSFKYLKLIEDSLKEIIKKYDIKIHIIGTREKLNINESYIKYIKWSEETEVQELQKFSIGVMPLKNTKWELGKCSYKLIQYMGCGIPVIASPIGMNKKVITHGVNGFLAKNDEEWILYFKMLIENFKLREKMGKQGRKIVEDNFSLEKSYQKFKESITLEK